MAYIPKEWKDLPDETTPIQASDLNHIEQGIGDLSTKVDTLNTNVGDLSTLNTTEKSNLVGAINDVYQNNVYSTDETVVGKWINGKPIYRKVVELPKITTTNKDVTVNCNINNLDKIINLEGIIYINNSQGDLGIPLNFYNSSAQQYSFLTFYRKSPSQIIMRVWTATIGGFAMLYYTKTTD